MANRQQRRKERQQKRKQLRYGFATIPTYDGRMPDDDTDMCESFNSMGDEDEMPYVPITEILPGVFLGDAADGKFFKGAVVTVYEKLTGQEHPNFQWVPIMESRVEPSKKDKDMTKEDWIDYLDEWKASRIMLLAATEAMHEHHLAGTPVITHCYAGVERSPCVMAIYLVRYGYQPNIYSAYSYIKAKRPIVQERYGWIPESLYEALGMVTENGVVKLYS